MPPPCIIAIDGPSASGKGTVARRLAAHFGFAHLDTGLLYRAVGLAVLRAGGDPADVEMAGRAALALARFYLDTTDMPPSPQTLSPQRGEMEGTQRAALGRVRGDQDIAGQFDFAKLLADPELRGDAASVAASKVAAIPGVRAALLKFQQDFCVNPPGGRPGAVLDGRDIGTVIAPDAAVKIYVTASAEARALRRFKELQGRGGNATYAAVLADMKERDARDASRSAAPAKPAVDAVMLDTTNMTADQAFAEAVKIAESKLPRR